MNYTPLTGHWKSPRTIHFFPQRLINFSGNFHSFKMQSIVRSPFRKIKNQMKKKSKNIKNPDSSNNLFTEKISTQDHRSKLPYVDKDVNGPGIFSISNLDEKDIRIIIGCLEKEKTHLSSIISGYNLTPQMNHAIGRQLNRDTYKRINELLMILKWV